ncbi:MAG: glycosyltransferase family 1 protein [Bacteroidia bacterium]|jgi:glycosyltransferase involved in cell wall biosynthesis
MNIPVSEKQLRIGFDAKRIFRNPTGLGNYSRFVVESLMDNFPQHRYYLYTPDARNDLFTENSTKFIIQTPQGLLNSLVPSLWRSFSLPHQLNQDGLDVYHGLSNELPFGIRSFKGKKIVTIHDLIFLRYPQYYNTIDRLIYTRKFKYACNEADLIIAISEQTAQDMIDFFGIAAKKIKVVYQDCHPRFRTRASDTDRKRVQLKYQLPETFLLNVGTHEPRKDQLNLIKAFHQANLAGMELVLVGRETAYTQKLHQEAQEKGIHSKVHFIHHMEPADLPVVFQLATLFVYASEFEGFGIPVLEAFRSEVPVILAQTSSLVEVGGKAAAYFPAGNSNTLAEQMQFLAGDPSERIRLIQAGNVQKQLFDSTMISKQLMEIYTH